MTRSRPQSSMTKSQRHPRWKPKLGLKPGPAQRTVRSAITGIALAALVLTAAGCAGAAMPGGGAGPAGVGGRPGGAPLREVAMAREVEVNGLELEIHRVAVERDRVRVDAVVHNPGDDQYSLLLGGCGPSQGRVSAGGGWREVYYQAQPDGDLGGPLNPRERRSGSITLKPAVTLDPNAVTRLQLHPGYVLNTTTGQLELLQVMLSLEEGETP